MIEIVDRVQLLKSCSCAHRRQYDTVLKIKKFEKIFPFQSFCQRILHSKFSRDRVSKKSGMSPLICVSCKLFTNSAVIASASGKKLLTLLGELSPFWNSDLIRHHSGPFLEMISRLTTTVHHVVFTKRTLVGVLHSCKCVVGPFGTFPKPNDFFYVDTLQDRNHSAPLIYRSDRISTRPLHQVRFFPVLLVPIWSTFLDRYDEVHSICTILKLCFNSLQSFHF